MHSLKKLIAGLSILFATGPIAAADKFNYEDHIVPIFRSHCANCHNAGKAKGDLDLMTYGALLKGGSSGAVVDAGNSAGSRLFQLMAHLDEPKMPPSGQKVPSKDLDTVKTWIDQGILERAGGQAKASKKPKMDLALAPGSTGKPAGKPALPTGDWLLEPYVKAKRANMAYSLAASPWAPLIAVAGQRQVLLFHSDTFELLGVLPFPEGQPHVVRFSRNGSLIMVAGGIDGKFGKVVIYKVETGERVGEVGSEPDAILAADISPDQSLIAIGGTNKLVKILSIKDGETLFTIKKHTDWVLSCEFSPDGVLLATGDRSGGLVVWESQTGREFYTLNGHGGAISSVTWRGDSNVLASASEDTTIRLWEMINGTQIKSWGAHGGGVLDAHFTHDGRIVSVGRDNVPKIWNGDGALQKGFEAFGDVSVRAIFSHDGGKVFAGDWSGTIRCWSAKDGKRLAEFTSNPPGIPDRLAAVQKELDGRRAELTASEQAFKASQHAHASKLAELEGLKKGVAEVAGEEKPLQAKLAAAKAALEKAKVEVKPLEAAAAQAEKNTVTIAQNAQAVKEALAAALDSEKALQLALAAQETASKSIDDQQNRTKQAVDKLAGDQSLKTLLAAGETNRQAVNASKEQTKKSLEQSAAQIKQLTASSAAYNQGVDKAKLAAQSSAKALAEKQKLLPPFATELKTAGDQLASLPARKKAIEEKLKAKQTEVTAVSAAMQQAQSKRDALALAVTNLGNQMAKLRRASVFAELTKQRALVEEQQNTVAKTMATAKSALEKFEQVRMANDELGKRMPAITAAAESALAAANEAKENLESKTKDMNSLQALAAEREQLKLLSSQVAAKLRESAAKAGSDALVKDAAEKSDASAKAATKSAEEMNKLLAKAQAEQKSAAADYQQLAQQADLAKKELAEATKKRSEAGQQIPGLKAAADSAKIQLEEMTKQLASHKLAVDSLTHQLAKLAAN